MALDFSKLTYLPCQDLFSRPVEITPAGGATYKARGIYGTQPVNIIAEDNSQISDQQTILDIREVEFAVLPRQGDRIYIPRDGDIPAAGWFEVVDSGSNGGGETTLVIAALAQAPVVNPEAVR
jgi:hypothetical protein